MNGRTRYGIGWLGAALALVASPPAAAVPRYEDHPPRILVEAPSEVIAGEDFPFRILVADTWGAEGPAVPTAGITTPVSLHAATDDPAGETTAHLRVTAEAAGRSAGRATLRTPGLWTVTVTGDGGLSGESAPIRVLESPPALRVYWGDLHAHLHTPGQGHDGVLPREDYRRTLREALVFARDVAGIDFCAPTPHVQTAGGLGRDTGNGTVWSVIGETLEEFHDPGRFVTFPGYEWQGDAGDHCVVWPGPVDFVAPADFRALGRVVRAKGGLLTAHAVYLPTRFEPRPPVPDAVEVMRDGQEMHGLGLEALAQGIVPAFLGCSDTHGGAIGATSLTGIRAPELTRAAVLDAVRNGRTWATNGERIVLDFRVDLAGDVPVLRLRGTGTAPVTLIEFYRDEEVVAQARGFGEGREFRFEWEDQDLLRAEYLERVVTYHARVVQASANRYAPSFPDVAVASPVAVEPEPRHFNAAYARAGGTGDPPGREIAALREAWSAFRPAPDRALRARPTGPVAWSDEDDARLAAAVTALVARSGDRPLAGLVALARRVQGLARAWQEADRLSARLADASRRTPDAAANAGLRAELDAVAARIATATVGSPDLDWPALERTWFVPRELTARGEELHRRLARLDRRTQADTDRRVVLPDSARTRVVIDPRVVESLAPLLPRAEELAAEFTERWGFTSPPVIGRVPSAPGSPAPDSGASGVDSPALTVHIVAEGAIRGARLVGRGDWSVPLERDETGWTASVPHARLPEPGALAVEFPSPAVVSAVRLTTGDGEKLAPRGVVTDLEVTREEALVQVRIAARIDTVDVQLNGGNGRPLWSGSVAPGDHTFPFEAAAWADTAAVTLHWGFAGWRRAGSVEVPGHDAARADGFGVAGDGRAALALGRGILLVDPVLRETEEIPYPPRRRHDAGKEFCVVPLRNLTMVRGAHGPAGGWAGLLDPRTAEWRAAPDGPASGTIARHPADGYGWLTGNKLHRRIADGSQRPSVAVAAEGRLLAFDPGGWPVVRGVTGEAVRLNPATGEVAARIRGRTLAADAHGTVIRLSGMDARHRELARGVELERVLPDGTVTGPHRLDLKTSPLLDPPLRAAFAPDGALLILGGTTWWRREPDHDWWGAVIERWEPVWTGEVHAR